MENSIGPGQELSHKSFACSGKTKKHFLFVSNTNKLTTSPVAELCVMQIIGVFSCGVLLLDRSYSSENYVSTNNNGCQL
jgi:hypothetical protein